MRKNFEDYKKGYYLKKDWVFPFSEVQKDSLIVLYGAGDVGQAYYNQLQLTKYCTVKKWIDSDVDYSEIYGMQIDEPIVLKSKFEFDYVVIAVYDSSIATSINNILLKFEIPQNKIIWNGNERTCLRTKVLENRVLNPIQERLQCLLRRRVIEQNDYAYILMRIKQEMSEVNKFFIPRLVIPITSKCTLRCEKCNNLIPMYKHPTITPVESVVADIMTFLEKVDAIVTIELIGGEPFIHPQLKNIVKVLAEQKKIFEVEITTNGTIMPTADLLDYLENNKITVCLSEYSCVDSTIFQDAIQRKNIRLEVFRDNVWIDSGGIHKRDRDEDEQIRYFAKCDASYMCKTLSNGKLYTCPRSLSLYDLGICSDEEGYLSIEDSDKNDIKAFFTKIWDPSCEYCDYADKWRRIPAGEQMKYK